MRTNVNQFDGNSIHLMIHSGLYNVGERDFFVLDVKNYEQQTAAFIIHLIRK